VTFVVGSPATVPLDTLCIQDRPGSPEDKVVTEIRRVGVLSLAKIVGLIYGLIGLVVWLFMGCFFFFGIITQPSDSTAAMAFIIPFFCLLPLFYGVIGFVAGAIIGLVYNAVAGRLGGIEIELVPAGDADIVVDVNEPV
jgi:hypothetical protein